MRLVGEVRLTGQVEEIVHVIDELPQRFRDVLRPDRPGKTFVRLPLRQFPRRHRVKEFFLATAQRKR